MANTYNYGVRIRVCVMYKECLHNHAANDRGHVLDGCGLFEATGPNGTPEAMVCATCSCHRNFHRRVEVDLPHRHGTQAENDGSLPGPQPQVRQPTSRGYPPTLVPEFTGLPPWPQVHQETSTRHEGKRQDLNQPHDVQNHNRDSPLSPDRVEGYSAGQAMETRTRGQKRRITGDQNQRLKAIADRNNWKMFREYSNAEVSRICSEVGIEKECLKAWIFYHRNERAARQAAANFRTIE